MTKHLCAKGHQIDGVQRDDDLVRANHDGLCSALVRDTNTEASAFGTRNIDRVCRVAVEQYGTVPGYLGANEERIPANVVHAIRRWNGAQVTTT